MSVKPTTRLGYMFGLGGRKNIPYESPLNSNQDSIARGQKIGVEGYSDIRSAAPRPPLRKAGDVFPLGLLEPGYIPEPYVPELLVRDFDFSISDESDF